MATRLSAWASGSRESAGPLSLRSRERRFEPADAPTVELELAQPTRLRQLLISLDLLAATLAWVAVLSLAGGAGRRSGLVDLVALPVLVLAFGFTAHARGLYRAQVCSIRAVEVQRLGQVVLLVGCAAALAGPTLGLRLPGVSLVVGGLVNFVLATTFRAAYRNWLSTGRRQGRFQRQVVIIGDNAEACDLLELVTDQPQLGLQVVGVIGPPEEEPGPALGPPLLGPVACTEALVRASGASGVLIAASAIGREELNEVTRDLLQAGIHVHLSTGLHGFAAHRLRPQLLAQESVLYLEPLSQARWQLAVKRVFDVGAGVVIAAVSLPIVAVAAVAIKLDDGGPVVFRQTRVGRRGKHFTMLKLRTMVPDAEARYDELAVNLGAREGPLVKLHSDPRVTRVGRVLRATSIDELPQLLNVFRGSMSLVGPRPNLLVEAEGLDPAFLAHKCQVRPGISGLWQVEARDDPSFTLYRRLDVFYLENWSLGLDLAILLATLQRVVARALRLLLFRRSDPSKPVEQE